MTTPPVDTSGGKLEFDVNRFTGHVTLVATNAQVSSYDLESSANNANGDFIRANWIRIPAFTSTLSSANQSYELDQESTPGTTILLNGSYDLGAILPTGLSTAQYIADLTDPMGLNNGPSSYGVSSGATINAPVFVNVITPEPASLAFAALASTALRRRSKTKSPALPRGS